MPKASTFKAPARSKRRAGEKRRASLWILPTFYSEHHFTHRGEVNGVTPLVLTQIAVPPRDSRSPALLSLRPRVPLQSLPATRSFNTGPHSTLPLPLLTRTVPYTSSAHSEQKRAPRCVSKVDESPVSSLFAAQTLAPSFSLLPPFDRSNSSLQKTLAPSQI